MYPKYIFDIRFKKSILDEKGALDVSTGKIDLPYTVAKCPTSALYKWERS